MSSPTIVPQRWPPALNILKGSQPGRSPGRKVSMVHYFSFECFEKALCHCIVPTVAFSTAGRPGHTLHNRVAFQLIPEFIASILDATI